MIYKVSTTPVTPEVKARNELLGKLDDWNFDLFEVDSFTNGQPLLLIGVCVCVLRAETETENETDTERRQKSTTFRSN